LRKRRPVTVGWVYWFSVPFIGISIALVFYVASLLVARA
jgi:hypothetical protein